MSTASLASSVTYSSVTSNTTGNTGQQYFSSSAASINSGTPSFTRYSHQSESPFMMGSSNSSFSTTSTVSPSMRPNSCSPPLMFSGRAFSSLSSIDARTETPSQQHLQQQLRPVQQVNLDEEETESRMQDFVFHLLTDLESI
jgi:hypothetical protein